MGLMFAPAEPGRIKNKKRKKKLETSSEMDGSSNTVDLSTCNRTPQSKKTAQSQRDASPTPSVDTPTKPPPTEKSSPPPRPKRRYSIEDAEKDDEIWYAKWWMFCFPDGTNLMPKR